MSDQPEFPALSDDEIHKSLDDIATLLSSQGNRLDEQTKVLNRLREVATEARQAAFAAREQTDPQNYGELIGQAIEGRLARTLKQLDSSSAEVLNGMQRSNASFQETTTAHSNTLRLMDEHRMQKDRDVRLLPWVGLGAVFLAVAMTVMLPRFLASYGPTCGVIGGVWTTTSTGTDVCAFYRE
ncbi:hypothetical protein FIU97_20585 (plasmid) [Roseivivax sp. THAF40]|uniref:hypothetical protein n=1 Tax=Roseivivax sp. THAF40 TaxID=2587858 RepID=UPI0012680874|nr:hypothetical protein [Roseivivax sp. THAF40]QFT48999.1 hypothetical protein FIU97_20585 [Roseivivax sp. THAF40]